MISLIFKGPYHVSSIFLEILVAYNWVGGLAPPSLSPSCQMHFNAFNQAYQNGARFFPFVDSFKFPFQAFCINQERRGAIQNKSMGNLNRIQKLAPFEKENPTSSTLHILKLSSRCPTMDSLVKFDNIIEIFYEFYRR